MTNKEIRTIIGVLLCIIGFFDLNPTRIANYVNNHIVKPVPVVVIDKPNDSLIALTKPVSDVILDKADKKYLAIFFNEFSDRKYEDANMQNINDILTIAGKEYLGDIMHGKYPKLSEGVQKLLSVQEIESADTKLAPAELKEISDRFKALAWNLVQ